MRELVEHAFACVGRRIKWSGKGVDEVGIDTSTGKDLVCIDPRYFRSRRRNRPLVVQSFCSAPNGAHPSRTASSHR